MNEHVPQTATIVFLATFLVLYLFWLIRNTIKSRIDLYDLLLLSTVALVPCVFVFFPPLAYWLARFVGVAFPFVLLFGGLFLLVFIGFYRLIKRINSLTLRNIKLVQELSLVRHDVSRLEGRLDGAAGNGGRP